jgi:hypothetical protein
MIDRRQQLRFPIEPANAFRIDRQIRRQDLRRDAMIEPSVARRDRPRPSRPRPIRAEVS